ncbi:MAG: DUF3990 domain-containing protein [Blautia sp.]|nr:DUF3990 domain-containing protein [Blautia sp.]
MEVYHTGFFIIPSPDIHHGRVNADFGQGFYLSPDREFSQKWAKYRKGEETYLNHYQLSLQGLRIKRFERDEEWFRYLFGNRNRFPDALPEEDVIIGPIACDTIFDTWGILSSGLLSPEKALALLTIGPCYTQVVLKSEKAASSLSFLGAEVLSKELIDSTREEVKREEEEYQRLFAQVMVRLDEDEQDAAKT